MTEKKKLLFVITQFYKGGAEVALLNLFRSLSPEEYEIDFLIFDQIIIKSAKSLVKEIPSWIRVCNAAEREGRFAIVLKAWFKLYQKITGRQLYRRTAYQFVKEENYDIAFSYGEWLSPEFVAKKVRAKRKMIWIHTDIDKASYVNEKVLLGFDEMYSNYIFVSEHSKESAERQFSVLKGKSIVIHNMCDDEKIREMAEGQPEEMLQYPKPWIVSVGNLRKEKNYPRQIQVMKILKDRGVRLTCFCIGSQVKKYVYYQIKGLLKKYQLEEEFILLGGKQNPYQYMKKADAIIVLSDFESWSLVITEAKILGIPVIATATSGAKEQLEDGKTGILTLFDPEEIADRIQDYLENPSKKQAFHHYLQGFSTNQNGLQEFSELF